MSHLGSGGPSANGFMESLQRERKTRKASFWRTCEKRAAVCVLCIASVSCTQQSIHALKITYNSASCLCRVWSTLRTFRYTLLLKLYRIRTIEKKHFFNSSLNTRLLLFVCSLSEKCYTSYCRSNLYINPKLHLGMFQKPQNLQHK